MSETTTTTQQQGTAQNGGGEGSDKELNFRRLEQERDQLKAENAELRPYRDRETVREAGFDPDSGEGKSLIRDLGVGAVSVTDGEELSEKLAEHAESEYGWKPTVQPTETEANAAEAARRQAEVAGSTSSADLTPDGELQAALEQARADNDFALASRIERRIKARQSSG